MLFMHLKYVSTKRPWKNLAYQVQNIYQSVIQDMDSFFWYITKMLQTLTEIPLKLAITIPCPVSGDTHWRISVTRLGKKKINASYVKRK